MGNQHGLDFLIRACHTVVSHWQDRSMTYTGRLHACAYSIALTTGMSYGRVPTESKYNPIQKRPILRALRHSKAYLNT
ncbi:lps-assembly lptd [Gossypium arboreum]|uniref:Lps-assembly lptd n=1 Tax=Gossypium arboreum TaxID=29729 RepID=A0A0B0MF68_GOSAR|nr:lps-assembly lptd [Gossypium arboreum]